MQSFFMTSKLRNEFENYLFMSMNWVRTVSALQTSKQFMKKVKTVQTLLIYTSLNWENIDLYIISL